MTPHTPTPNPNHHAYIIINPRCLPWTATGGRTDHPNHNHRHHLASPKNNHTGMATTTHQNNITNQYRHTHNQSKVFALDRNRREDWEASLAEEYGSTAER